TCSGILPSGPGSRWPCSTCWSRPATRTSTNSSRLLAVMARNLTRSSRGLAGSRASSSTRWLNWSQEKCRFRYSRGSGGSLGVTSASEADQDIPRILHPRKRHPRKKAELFIPPLHGAHIRPVASARASGFPDDKGGIMSKEAAAHHRKAAEHHEHAAKHHRSAAEHHETGNHESAAHHAHSAHGHHQHATHHA